MYNFKILLENDLKCRKLTITITTGHEAWTVGRFHSSTHFVKYQSERRMGVLIEIKSPESASIRGKGDKKFRLHENDLCDMKVDSEVMFECLMYINAYYYPVFATCESIMALAKYITPQRDTPNIGQDAAVCFTRLSVEILKLVVFYRYKHGRKKLVTAFAVLMTFITIATIFYTLLIQDPAIKLEKVLSSLTIMLTVAEVAFGTLFLLSCYKRVEYY